MGLIERKISLNGLKVNYAEAGKGQPMIFLHNGGGFWQSWEHQLKHFANDFHVFGIDWPGFGDSELPTGLLTLDLLTDTLREFIHTKKLKDVILIGNCIGGSAALKYSMKHPESVEKLLLFNICPGNLIYRYRFFRKALVRLNNWPKTKDKVGKALGYVFTKTFVRRYFPKILFGPNADKRSPLFQRYVEKFKQSTQTTSRINMVFSVHTFNLLNYIDDGAIPEHLLVWADKNRVTPLKEHGFYHRDLLKPKQWRVLRDVGHLGMYEAPNEVNTLIKNYISIKPNKNVLRKEYSTQTETV